MISPAHKGIPSLVEMLDAAIGATPAPLELDDIARTSCRIPRVVLEEVAALAQANRMSTSLVINLLLDRYLTEQGRPGYAELAPWYPAYALRQKTAET